MVSGLDKRPTFSDDLPPARRARLRGVIMNIRTLLAGGAIATALMLGACHKADEATSNEANASAELSNMADTNANDEMMNEDSGNMAATASAS